MIVVASSSGERTTILKRSLSLKSRALFSSLLRLIYLGQTKFLEKPIMSAKHDSGNRAILVKAIRSLSQSAFAVGFLVLLLANTALGQEPVIHGRVVGIIDGDTLKVLVTGQQLLRVRLAFCDAPEKKQAFGVRAKQAMSELVLSRQTGSKHIKIRIRLTRSLMGLSLPPHP
jgi:hypothetical protein